jgi:hypothetical protein
LLLWACSRSTPHELGATVFDIEIEHWPNYGGALIIIAAPSEGGSGQASKRRR